MDAFLLVGDKPDNRFISGEFKTVELIDDSTYSWLEIQEKVMKYKWTRTKAIKWISDHQYINTVGDYRGTVMDGDGLALYEAKQTWNIDLNEKQLAELLSFVFNDYVKFNTGGDDNDFTRRKYNK